MTQFHVNPDQVRAHAGNVGDIAGELTNAASQPAGLQEGALGLFVQFLALGLQFAVSALTEVIGHASSAMDDVSDGLVKSADSYERTDQDHAAALQQIGERA